MSFESRGCVSPLSTHSAFVGVQLDWSHIVICSDSGILLKEQADHIRWDDPRIRCFIPVSGVIHPGIPRHSGLSFSISQPFYFCLVEM